MESTLKLNLSSALLTIFFLLGERERERVIERERERKRDRVIDGDRERERENGR